MTNLLKHITFILHLTVLLPAPVLSQARCLLTNVNDRVECGFPGIRESECISASRACCYEEVSAAVPFCYQRDGCNYRQGRSDCGFDGISREQCLNRRCCYDDSDSNNYFCYFNTQPATPVPNECVVAQSNRINCGADGITEAQCTNNNCCFDDSVPGTTWCYQRAGVVSPVLQCSVPNNARVNCGFAGISRTTCERWNCCYDDSVPDIYWCYQPADCDHNTGRTECTRAFPGILRRQCLALGCCFDKTVDDEPWCFMRSP